jgi:hypothetical protein
VAARKLRGATAVVSEAEDGTVQIRVNGHVLAPRRYPKEHAELDPGVIVEHKHLDGVFEWIAAQQQARDLGRLTNPKISRREKHRIRAGAPVRSPAPSPG